MQIILMLASFSLILIGADVIYYYFVNLPVKREQSQIEETWETELEIMENEIKNFK